MKCYDYHYQCKKTCKTIDCRYWIQNKISKNCGIIAAKNEQNMTLEDVGKIFKVTRMRICQIEKSIMGKLKSSLQD